MRLPGHCAPPAQDPQVEEHVTRTYKISLQLTNLLMSQPSDILSPNFSDIPHEPQTIRLVTEHPRTIQPNEKVLEAQQHASSSNETFESFNFYQPGTENSHELLTKHLGENNKGLLPKMKTIELYRQNAKKSQDPYVLFQFAQYILQTGLLMSEPENPFRTDLLQEAQHYLKKLADKSYVDAQYLLADGYSSGCFGKIDNKQAFQLFQAAAKHGHIESCYRAAHCYEEGIGTQRDARKAVNFLKSAASRNHPAAMYKLGVYSYYGRMGLGKDDNTKKAGIKWLTIAVSKANELICAAPYELARIYDVGFKDILISDKKYALELYVQAASLGHVPSALILGKAYELGEIVPQDANLSIHYYTQAALANSPEAMLAMCAWYLVGAEPYLPKNDTEAYAWALRAAKLEYSKAQFAVAHFLEKGIGCEVDAVASQKWIQRAARNGDLRAKQKIGNNVEVTKEEKECIIM